MLRYGPDLGFAVCSPLDNVALQIRPNCPPSECISKLERSDVTPAYIRLVLLLLTPVSWMPALTNLPPQSVHIAL